MDEEEYQEEEQSDSKINLGSFFERMDSVEKVASNALSKANANFGIIENQKALINSLNVSIEAIETKVRDIANYIIIEKKIAKDEEADRLVEEQDKEQKDQMIERLMGLKGDQGEQGEPGAPAPEEGGGGGFMSFLKSLATLGIAAFVTTQMWPVILPLIGPLLGKLGLGLMVGAGGLLGGFLGAQLFKVPIVGKKMGPAVEKGIKKNFEKGGKSIQKAAESMGKDGKLEIPTGGEGGGGEGGAEEVESKDNLLEGGESLEDTLKDKDLIKGKPIKNRRGRIIGYEKPEEKDLETSHEFTEDLGDTTYSESYSESEDGSQSTFESNFEGKPFKYDRDTGKMHLLGVEITTDGANEYMNLSLEEKTNKDVLKEIVEKHKVTKIEPVTENKDLDLSLKGGEGGEGGNEMTNDANLLSQVLETPSTNNGQVVTAPANTPNTTSTDVKLTKIPVPFLNSISNQYLSITGEKIPPEFYRQYA